MGSSENYASNDTSWTAAANWTIVAGSLVNSLTFESTPSLIRDDDNNDHHQISPVDSKSKSPLILYSPPDSAPCEITINFAQKHEVRQVYVRSTARVYEIYSAPELQSSSQYLCTVLCDIATRNEEVQHATNIEAAVLAHARSSIQELAEEKLGNGRILTPNEDDWVEVRVCDSPPVINRNSPSNSDINPKRNTQDLYEATTKITDAKPSTSLTLRLLSLQNKGYVCVDELYVFGDPVGTNSLDNQVSSMENSIGNSRIAMHVPAFFHLSKTKGIGGGEDRYNIDTRQRQELQEIGSKEGAPVDAEKKIQEDVRLHKVIGSTSKPVQHEILQQVPNIEGKFDISCSHCEGVLDQLVSRVNRNEDILLRFEKSMLKPINNIDVRLQRVEKQLDVLAKKTENSTLNSCFRISAPDFSCSESETSSFYNSESGDISDMAFEANKSHSPSPLTSFLADATPVLVNDTNLQPSLVVTAFEFSNDDDKVEDHAEHAVSIDDPLAYAPAGFLFSSSTRSKKYSQTIAVKAPDFPTEEENTNEKIAPPAVGSELNDTSIYFSEYDGTKHMGNSLSSVANNTALKDGENLMGSLDDNKSLKMVEGVDKQGQHSEDHVVERQELQEIGSKEVAPVDAEKKIQEDVGLHKVAGPTSKPVQHEILQEVSNTGSKFDISRNHCEGVLDHPVSRVNKNEDILLRFEESMLKPVNSIDVWLQQVEKQLDVLAKKTENSTLVSCFRISAPDFSCSESETSSIYNSESGDISDMTFEANKSHSPSPLTSFLADATPVLVNDTNLQPGLVVTAFEFSNYDDKVEDHAEHAVSIDDPLAYTPAGFLSSSSMRSKKYSQTIAVKAPDFPTEEENTDEKIAPPAVGSELNDTSIYFSESDGTKHLGNSLSSVANNTTLKDDENLMRSLDDDRSLKMVEGVDEQCQHSEDHVVDRQELQEIGSKEVAPVYVEKKIQEDVRLHRVVGPTSKPVQHEILQQVSNTESKSDISRNHCVGVLDQLVSRVNKIEVEDHVVESVKESSKVKEKSDVSIDDLLAYTPAGFLSSSLMRSKKYSQTTAVKAPDFPTEEENTDEKMAPPAVESGLNIDTSIYFSESDGTKHMGNSLFSVANNTALKDGENLMRSLDDNRSLKMVEGVDEQCQHSEDHVAERQEFQEIISKEAAPVKANKKIQEDVRLHKVIGLTSKPVQCEILQQVSNTESKFDISCNHCKGVLDQLVSQVSRIEDLLLRFEESMLKPINNIDAKIW